MSLLRFGVVPKSLFAVLVRVVAPVCLLLLAGCASRQASHQVSPQWRVKAPDTRVASYRREALAEVEDERVDPQAPPPRRLRSEPDDPTEPFSPNYGSVRQWSNVDIDEFDGGDDVSANDAEGRGSGEPYDYDDVQDRVGPRASVYGNDTVAMDASRALLVPVALPASFRAKLSTNGGW